MILEINNSIGFQNESIETTTRIKQIINDVNIETSDILDMKILISKILEFTLPEFQKIYTSDLKCFLTEALARPSIEVMWVKSLKGNLQQEALFRFLDLAENQKITFPLYKHMLSLIQQDIEKWMKQGKNEIFKYSINAYPKDVLDSNFIDLMNNFPYSNRLVIELTEKKEWSEESIEILKDIQGKTWIRIALDDINPIPSDVNWTMDTLKKCKKKKLILDLGKIDGPYFQYLAKEDNYRGLKSRILEDYNNSWIKNFIIEYIETEQQFIFAKQLDADEELKELGIRFWYQGFYFKENKKTIS
jgi:EAL domain-containing protein (putative c-di-GMP-specific phosphodiesterase class I)